MIRILILFCVIIVNVYAKTIVNFPSSNKFDEKSYVRYPVNISEIPYQVSLQFLGVHFCGGTLISKKFAITAAHCVLPVEFEIRVGSTQHRTGGKLVEIEERFIHPKSDGKDYDFAILILQDWDSTNVTHGFAKLPEQNEDIPDGELLRVSGWGDPARSGKLSEYLLAANVPKVNQKVCENAYPGRITDRMFCAENIEGDKDSCQGDSGGPLATKHNVLVGVVSWRGGCRLPNDPRAYARVAAVRDWIKDITGI